MKTFIFITSEGSTYQPGSECIEPDIENCQVLGFAGGADPEDAFENLVRENDYLLDTTFDELICLELRHEDCFAHKSYFHLSEERARV